MITAQKIHYQSYIVTDEDIKHYKIGWIMAENAGSNGYRVLLRMEPTIPGKSHVTMHSFNTMFAPVKDTLILIRDVSDGVLTMEAEVLLIAAARPVIHLMMGVLKDRDKRTQANVVMAEIIADIIKNPVIFPC